MIAGFLASFLGSSVILGSVTGLIATGVLPLIWVPIYSTVETIEDMTAPFASKIVSKFDAGRVLVCVELTDILLCSIALVVIVAAPSATLYVLVVYLLAISVIPLIIDLAEEFYASDVAGFDPEQAAKFTAVLHSMISAVSLLVATPLGAFLGTVGVRVVLSVNIAASIFGVLGRARAVHSLSAARKLTGIGASENELGEAGSQSAPRAPVTVSPNTADKGEPRTTASWLRKLGQFGLVSPITSGILATVGALYSSYFVLWASTTSGDPGATLPVLMIATGLGAVIGPQIARKVRERKKIHAGLNSLLIWYLVGLALGIGVAASGVSGNGVVPLGCIAAFAFASATSSILTLVIIERQVTLTRTDLAWVAGWGQSFSAGGSLLGTWVGLALGVARGPELGLGVAWLLVAVVTVLSLRWRSRSSATEGGTGGRSHRPGA